MDILKIWIYFGFIFISFVRDEHVVYGSEDSEPDYSTTPVMTTPKTSMDLRPYITTDDIRELYMMFLLKQPYECYMKSLSDYKAAITQLLETLKDCAPPVKGVKHIKKRALHLSRLVSKAQHPCSVKFYEIDNFIKCGVNATLAYLNLYRETKFFTQILIFTPYIRDRNFPCIAKQILDLQCKNLLFNWEISYCALRFAADVYDPMTLIDNLITKIDPDEVAEIIGDTMDQAANLGDNYPNFE